MHAVAAAGASFLTAVLWFDLMFDVQTRKHGAETLPDDVLASISAYYRRVTTEATPMNRLISIVMLATLGALAAQVVERGLAGLHRAGLVPLLLEALAKRPADELLVLDDQDLLPVAQACLMGSWGTRGPPRPPLGARWRP